MNPPDAASAPDAARPWRYRALDRDGAVVRAEARAVSRAALAIALDAQALQLIDARPAALASRLRLARAFAPRAHSVIVIEFTADLAELLDAGVEIDVALDELRCASRSRRFAYLLGHLHDTIRSGTRLADALVDWPRSFGPRYVAMVRAGEACGRVSTCLVALERSLLREKASRERLARRLGYPLLVALATLAVAAFVAFELAPALLELYRSLGLPAPALAGWLNTLSVEALLRHVGVLMAVSSPVVVAGHRLRRHRRRERSSNRAAVSRSGRTSWRHERAASRYADAVGLLYGHGVPLVDAMVVAERGIGIGPLREDCVVLRQRVQSGSSLTEAARGAAVMPPILVRLATRGERSGQLAGAFDRAARALTQRADRRLARLEAALPAIAMGIATLVLIVLVQAVFLPLYELLAISGMPI